MVTPLKIVILGNQGVGKTCLIRSYTSGTFTTDYKPTVGADFVIDSKHTPTDFKLQIWDMSVIRGYYRGTYNAIIKKAAAILIVYDVTDEASIEEVVTHFAPLLQYALDHTTAPHVILVANKVDKVLRRQGPPRKLVEALNLRPFRKRTNEAALRLAFYCLNVSAWDILPTPSHFISYDCLEDLLDYIPWTPEAYFEVSAKTGEGVHELFKAVAEAVVAEALLHRELEASSRPPPPPLPMHTPCPSKKCLIM